MKLVQSEQAYWEPLVLGSFLALSQSLFLIIKTTHKITTSHTKLCSYVHMFEINTHIYKIASIEMGGKFNNIAGKL